MSGMDRKTILSEDIDIYAGYHIHSQKLGEGGFGTVRLGTHIITGQKVAIKRMDKQKLGSDLPRVKTETLALKQLDHKNIAKLLQIIETNKYYYLILEYCSGGELFDYLVSKTHLTENETKDIMNDMFDVLDYIHNTGFAHRDIKPENIMFDKNHKIKLIDFGLAAHCRATNNSMVPLMTACGSPAYAAPELLHGRGYLGSAVDIWSTGVLLYTLLTGTLPFDDISLPVLYSKIQSGFYPIPLSISKDAQHLISRMLDVNPQTRATIYELKTHPWLCHYMSRESIVNIGYEVRPSHMNVLNICRLKFPQINDNELERNCLTSYGYTTATYYLIKRNMDLFQKLQQDLAPSLPKLEARNRRRSRSVDTCSSSSDVSQTDIKKQKMDFNTLKTYRLRADTALYNNGSPFRTPGKLPFNRGVSPVARDSQQLIRNMANNTAIGVTSQRKNPLTMANNNNTPNRSTNSPTNGYSNTSGLAEKSCEKKTLLKRFLESATPTKSRKPRILKLSDDQPNVTRTKFTDPKLLTRQISEILKVRGVSFTHKSNFVLKCQIKSMNTSILSFNLEICQTDDHWLVIHRKRLKGNSWEYKKVCQVIDKISVINEGLSTFL
ncbi:maternal embryonic leucine zipper kinase-like [Oppia nitens]|uniref:maternal embryonic leucine zipper kinase-like n=1 Tax=Oppia nitens TaxID=1686743 RepID=UPI0023DC8C18|nr:maternal embryonic leucine zipper kinase-like [Oppia nitens]